MVLRVRNAQISIFLIIAAILLILGSFLIFRSEVSFFSDQKHSSDISSFVDNCLYLQTDRAIRSISRHGGWLYMPENKFFVSSQDNKFLVPLADGMSHVNGINYLYWYHYDDSNEEFDINIPSWSEESDEYSIKNQIKRYVEETLNKDCIKNFQAYEETLDVDVDWDTLNIDIEFIQNRLRLELDLPLKVVDINSNSTEFLDKFVYADENPLYYPYNLAIDIVVAQNNNSFIEKKTWEFLSAYQTSSSKDYLPPIYDFKLSLDMGSWNLINVENLIKRILDMNIPSIQFLSTDYYEMVLPASLQSSEFARGVANTGLRDYLSATSLLLEESPRDFAKYSEYTVEPVYNMFFPTSFKLSPSIGGAIYMPMAQMESSSFIPFFFTQYSTRYSLVNPIMFKIDSNVHNMEPFYFVIESNIDYNQPLSSAKKIDFSIAQEISSSNLMPANTLTCNPSQFISAPVFINITDPINNGQRGIRDPYTGIDGAIVEFVCGNGERCMVGETQINHKDSRGNEKSIHGFRLPIDCGPSRLEISKFGHQDLSFEIEPTMSEIIDLGEQQMGSAKTLNLNFRMQNILTGDRNLILNQYDKAFLVFENIQTPTGTSIVEINHSNQNNVNISLIPGNYNIQTFVIHENEIIIPAERKCISAGTIGRVFGASDECFDLDKITMESWVIGGFDYKDFEITINDLISSNNLRIDGVFYGKPFSYDSLEEMSSLMADLENYSKANTPIFY